MYDLREIHQSIEGGSLTPEGVQQLLQEGSNSALVNGGSSATGGPNGSVMPNNLDKERNMVNDDPRWQGENQSNFVAIALLAVVQLLFMIRNNVLFCRYCLCSSKLQN